jgi:RND family efflux transporter MFP subunit
MQILFKKVKQMETKKYENKKIIFRIVICLLILLLGLTGRKLLAGLKKPPAQAKPQEQSLKVEVITVQKKQHPVTITGYGEVRALNVVPIASEVSGKIIEIHPRLEAGEMIKKNDVLFRIDPRDYQTAVRTGQEQLKVLKRSLELEKKEFQRVSRLFRENNVGTASGVDMAEKIMLASNNIVIQVEQALELAKNNLERCTAISLFDGRVRQVSVEKGQFVVPGQNLLTLVDDSILEIHVPMDSRDAQKWLQFDKTIPQRKSRKWFSGLATTLCMIQWTEDDQGLQYEGELHRIVKFDQHTRTLTLAVRVKTKQELHDNTNGLPLVEGMFCFVNIPGKTMKNVTRLPRWAVSFENTVYLAVDNRLKTVSVTVERMENDFLYVSDGLKKGDKVITTRLINPLENSLLTITNQ